MLLSNKHTGLTVAAAIWAAAATTAAAQTLAFDVASVKANKSGDPVSTGNNPLGPGSVWNPTGGYFLAVNYPLVTYISFAYKIQGNQGDALIAQLPGWVLTEHFDIQARSNPNTTKDEARLMMRSLLAERFNLALHRETRQAPVLALVLVKPGKTGTHLQRHPEGSCSTNPSPSPAELIGPFPALCGGMLPLPASAPGLHNAGARDVTMGFIANALTAMARSDRATLDQTGLAGTFDFALEWADDAATAQPADTDLPAGATFLQAIKDQLGLKLESAKGPVEVLILDHVEHLSEN